MYKVNDTIEKGKTLMRDVYRETLMELAADNKNIVALDADLVSSSGMKGFFETYPEQSVQCGIAEANMIGVAAGLSLTGKIPFAHSFGTFATRRVCDQIYVSAAYAGLNVRIVGSDPGITAAFNGGTHMPFEDMAVLRSIPGITLIEPSDPVMLRDIIRKLVSSYGVYYIRLARKETAALYHEGSKFEIGKGCTLRDGTDVTLIASGGLMVPETLKAADMLRQDGISARVIDMFTWKPLDEELIVRSASETGAVVSAENHNVTGGLSDAVAGVLARFCPVPAEMVGVSDRFGQVGSVDFLQSEYRLTALDIVNAAKRAVERKG